LSAHSEVKEDKYSKILRSERLREFAIKIKIKTINGEKILKKSLNLQKEL